jgi:hypothetical protein
LIKSTLIVVLSLTLAAGAFLSRPGQQDVSVLRKEARGMTFRDRYLWVELADREGRVVFTGVFGHWLERGSWRPVKVGVAEVTSTARRR